MEKVLVIRLERIKAIMTTDVVHKYLKLQNRPYSINELTSVFDKEKHGKAAIQKSLDKLVDAGLIFAKTSSKQKIYCINQECSQNLEELKRIERELQTHSNEQLKKLQELEYEVKIQETTLNSVKCGMSLEEANAVKTQLSEKNRKLALKLDELMEMSEMYDMSEAKKKAEKNLKIYNKEYTKRKRICNDILDCILESYPGSKKQLYAEIGIDLV